MPPKMNLEIVPLLPQAVKTRDNCTLFRQNLAGSTFSALDLAGENANRNLGKNRQKEVIWPNS